MANAARLWDTPCAALRVIFSAQWRPLEKNGRPAEMLLDRSLHVEG